MDIKEKHPNKLLVEGSDDQHVIWALCEEYKLQENSQGESPHAHLAFLARKSGYPNGTSHYETISLNGQAIVPGLCPLAARII